MRTLDRVPYQKVFDTGSYGAPSHCLWVLLARDDYSY